MSNKELAKHRLQKALITLLDEKDFSELTVSAICKAAKVHRSTFYAYYDNQVALLADAYLSLQNLFLEQFRAYQRDSGVAYSSQLSSRYYLVPYLTFVKEHRELYRIYHEHSLDFQHQERLPLLVERIFTPIYHEQDVFDKRQILYMSTFFLAAITETVMAWVLADCCDSIDFMADTLELCIPKRQQKKG
ncbi:TetR/AcrR family transcriptional regulator [Streptococcus sp. zg-JUN1979]|uniref:TetR/AcrR family transcriptional regulator n=1 Tax=Streptococcus sp. zg-JUN1979 TaxID=3391450 RepID=UPI0039A776A4